MDCCVNKQLLVISVDNYNIIHKAHDIPNNITSMDDLYTHAIDLKWVTNFKNHIFFFIHMGKIIQSNQPISDLTNDIILLKCNKLNTLRAPGFFTGSDLVENIANLLVPSLFSSSNIDDTAISGYFNSNIAPLNSSNSPRRFSLIDGAVTDGVFPDTISAPNSVLNNIDSVADSDDTSDDDSNAIPSMVADNTVANTHTILPDEIQFIDPIDNLTNSLFEIIQPTATNNSVSDVVGNDINPIGNNLNDTVDNDLNDTVDNDLNDTVDNNLNDTMDNDLNDTMDNDLNDNVGGDIEPPINNINPLVPLTTDILSDTGASVNDTNLASQLLNIYETTNVQLNYQSIKEQYIDQFNYMNGMGFTDYTKIIIALYVCEGDCQAAINYYLS